MRAMGCICGTTSGEDDVAMHDTWYLGSFRSVQQAQNDINVRYRCRQPSLCSMRLLRVLLL